MVSCIQARIVCAWVFTRVGTRVQPYFLCWNATFYAHSHKHKNTVASPPKWLVWDGMMTARLTRVLAVEHNSIIVSTLTAPGLPQPEQTLLWLLLPSFTQPGKEKITQRKTKTKTKTALSSPVVLVTPVHPAWCGRKKSWTTKGGVAKGEGEI